MSQLYAELFGRVARVITKGKGRDSVFIVHTQTQNKDYKCVCPFFCPIEEGDAIYAICEIEDSHQLRVIRPPFVQIAMDKDSILRCFQRILKGTGFGAGKASRLYEVLASATKGSDELASRVISYLTELSTLWKDSKDDDLLIPYLSVVSKEQMRKLLSWWYKNRSLRRLYLFGLTNREIEACKLSHDRIYEQCLTNPYTLVGLSLEKCDEVLSRQNKTGAPEDRRCGQIVRKVHDYLTDRCWTGVPAMQMLRLFPDLTEQLPRLSREYEVVAEGQTIYLRYPYMVEIAVAEKIQTLMRSNRVTQDTPMDSKDRESADYVIKTLTQEQKDAIQGALDYPVSIITGAGGTGKCLHPDTPVLMYSGSIKLAKDIVIGDLLMGDDSTPRRVLSTCSGEDDMYEIIPNRGKSFVCNEPHVLTLKGIKPYISVHSNRNLKYIVRYSERGIIKRKGFPTIEDANKFISNLSEDIYDMPLNEYLITPESFKEYAYLYHNGIDFPEKLVPFDPYIIGLWLGDGHSGDTSITNTDPEIVVYLTDKLPEYGLELVIPESLKIKLGLDSNSDSDSENEFEFESDFEAQFNEEFRAEIGAEWNNGSNKNDIIYRIVGRGENYRTYHGNVFRNLLRELNMFGNKHIPDIYKFNSRSVRLQVLAGLIDSDGYRDPKGNYIEITQKSDQLADDIEYLAFSLGFMVTRRKATKSCTYKGEKRSGLYNRINIFGEGLEQIPVLLDRKKCHPRVSKIRATCQRFKVVPRGRGQYCGFTLDGNGRFLLGDFLVTHNTSIIGEIVHNLELRNIPYVVASFTGKAVSRIREAIKRKDPSTLHRLIARSHLIKKFKHLIIDEASMVTAELMYQFFKAFPYDYAITLVGDPHQLPPIGWGSLFDELLKAKCVPTFYLSQNHRLERIQSIGPDGSSQDLENGIMINANAIVNTFNPHSDGEDDPVPFDFVQTDNFVLIEGSIERVYDIVRAMYSQNIPSDQVTVITPYNKDLDDLNKTYQEIYNEGNRSVVDSRGKLWMVRDRVMMLENQYSINVFNGMEMMVVDLDEESIVAMTKDGTQHRFNLEPTDRKHEDDEPEEEELTVQLLGHAFAISVHKSQGSEWSYVIIYIPPNPANNTFLTRNLIYTAITRAKRAVWCVGDIDALRVAAVRPCPKRHETLAERLNPQLVAMVVPEPDIPADIPAIPIAIPTTLQITDTPD
jgi:hypothetical protein